MSDQGILRSNRQPGMQPKLAELSVGEVVINSADGVLYSRTLGGDVISWSSDASWGGMPAAGGDSVTMAFPDLASAPSPSTNAGRLIFVASEGRAFVSSGAQWIALARLSDITAPASAPPGAPSVSAVTAASGSVLVQWSAPDSAGTAAISRYRVQFSSNNGATWTEFPENAGASLYQTVTGLVNGTAYVFRVAAESSAGIGPYSAKSQSSTPFASASAVPVVGSITNSPPSYNLSLNTVSTTLTANASTSPPGGSLSYQWYKMKPGEENNKYNPTPGLSQQWDIVPGATSQTLAINGSTVQNVANPSGSGSLSDASGYVQQQWYVAVTAGGITQNSQVWRLPDVIERTQVVGQHPQDVANDDFPAFSAWWANSPPSEAPGATQWYLFVPDYWQISTNGGSTWSKIANSDYTPNLQATSKTAARYRAVYSTGGSLSYTNAAIYTPVSLPTIQVTITTQPPSTVADFSTVTAAATATSGRLRPTLMLYNQSQDAFAEAGLLLDSVQGNGGFRFGSPYVNSGATVRFTTDFGTWKIRFYSDSGSFADTQPFTFV